MWVIDIRHWLNEAQSGPAVPQLKRKVEKLKEIIVYATSDLFGDTYESNVKCSRRPGLKACKGYLTIEQTGEDEIYWICPVCGDEGVISGWKDLFWNVAIDDQSGDIH